MALESSPSSLNERTRSTPSQTWLRKRKITTIAFSIQTFFLGVEYSVVFLTLWLYIETLVVTDKPKLVYSITASAYLVSAVVMSVILGKIADKTREVNKIFLLSNFLAIIGNIFYAIYFSPVYLIIGRLIAGSAAPLKSVIAGELARSYSREELIAKFSLVGMSYGAGFLFGPAINFAFLKVDFYISSLHITVANAAGIYMAFIFFILDLTMYFFVYDLSKEYDLKAEMEKHEFENNESSSSSDIIVNESTSLVINSRPNSHSLCNIDLIVLLLSSYYIMMLMVSCDMDLPMIILNVLNWSVLELNIIVFSIGVVGVISMLYMSKTTVKEKALYILFVISLICCMLVLNLLLLIKHFHQIKAVTILLWCVWIFLFALICVVEETYLTSAFAKMVPSRIQTLAESIRLGFARCGSITALSTSVFLFDYFEYFTIISCSVLFTLLIIIVIRRKHFMYPKQRME